MISPSPLAVDIKPNQTNAGRAGQNTSNIHRDTGNQLIGNQVKRDGPELAANGQLKINGVGNNLAKDGPISGDGNNKATDGPQNGDGNNKATDGPEKSNFEKNAHKWKEFSETHLLPKSTKVSVLFNLISAPLRLLGQDNPIAKLLNKLSIGFTKLHQLGYAATGIGTALTKKNLFYVLSFGLEAIAGLLPLRKIYLFRGMASALDILPTAIKKYSKDEFKTFGESLPKTFNGIWSAIKDLWKNPQKFMSKEGIMDFLNTHVPIAGAALSILGNIIAAFGKDTLGGGVRDIGAIFNDFALLFSGDKEGIKSGQYYFGGSTIDLAANAVGKYGQSKGTSNGIFGKIRDCIHELALASDRWGQYLFVKFLNKQKHSNNVT